MAFRDLETADLNGKTALVRVDFNVPMDGGKVSDDTRLRSALPTIRFLSTKGAKVVLIAHFDRPKGKRVPEMSLKPIAEPLSALLEQPVFFADDCIGKPALDVITKLENGGVALLENLRFHPGEGFAHMARRAPQASRCSVARRPPWTLSLPTVQYSWSPRRAPQTTNGMPRAAIALMRWW